MLTQGRALRPLGTTSITAQDFAESVQLSQAKLEKLRAKVATTLNKALKEYGDYKEQCEKYTAKHSDWQLFTEHECMRMYRLQDPCFSTVNTTMSFGNVEGNYLDIAKFMRTDTTEDFLAVQKYLIDSTTDASVVRNVERESHDHLSYEGVKCVVFRPSAFHLRMGVFYFEAIGTGLLQDNKPYAFIVHVPINCHEVSNMLEEKRVLRVYLKTATILTPSDRSDASTELFMSAISDFKGACVPRGLFKRHLMKLHRVSSAIDKRAQCTTPLKARLCAACSVAFSLRRPKRVCVVCHNPVCRKCIGAVGNSTIYVTCNSAHGDKFKTPAAKLHKWPLLSAIKGSRGKAIQDPPLPTSQDDKKDDSALASHCVAGSIPATFTTRQGDAFDEPFGGSCRSAIEIDTSDMARVDNGYSSVGDAFYLNRLTMPSRQRSNTFENIQASIQEQELILREMQLAIRFRSP